MLTRLSAMALAFAAVFSVAAQAAAPVQVGKAASPPTAAENFITVRKVPVTQTNGTVKYYDITTGYKTNANGVPVYDATVSSVVLTTVPTTPLLQNGNYVDSLGNEYVVSVAGPDAQGRFTYLVNGANSFNFSATFATGQVSGHPDMPAINSCNFVDGPAYGHTSASYGTIDVANASATSLGWQTYSCYLGNSEPQSAPVTINKYAP